MRSPAQLRAIKDAIVSDPDNRPKRPPFCGRNIPAALKELPRWVLWNWTLTSAKPGKPSKWTKAPRAPFNSANARASVDDPATWTTYAKAGECANIAVWGNKYPERVDGFGIVFVNGGGLLGVDVDGCRDPDTGELTPFATDLIARFGTYCEVSPTGTGVKLIGYGTFPESYRSRAELPDGSEIEIYCRGRYFTVTGQHVEPSPRELRDCAAAIDWTFETLIPKRKSTEKSGTRAAAPLIGASDSDIVHLLTVRDKNAAKWARLWAGDWAGYPSQSNADQALCNKLAYYARGDFHHIDALFRQSGLMRDKWQRADYRASTINDAIDSCAGRFYDPDHKRNGTRGATMSTSTNADNNVHGGNGLPPPPRRPLTDLGNAERLVDRHGDDVLYDTARQKWLVWNGCRWELDDTGEIVRRMANTARAILDEAKAATSHKNAEELARHAIASESAARITAAIRLAESQPGVPARPADLDSDPWLFNCANGTIDLRTGELREHRRADRITQLSPVEYDPHAQCPQWERALATIFPADPNDFAKGGDVKMISFIRRLFGYCLTGDVSEQILPILWGGGGNGKGLLIDTIKTVLGDDYAFPAPPDFLMVRRNEPHPTEKADLYRRRFVIASETGSGGRLNEPLVKLLTGGDSISARHLYQDNFSFKPSHKLVLLTNHRPQIKGTDKGMWRRVVLIPFKVHFWNPAKGEFGHEVTRRDNHLDKKLKAELPGILAWLVRGCVEWQTQGLCIPDEAIAVTESYRQKEDTFGSFIAECITIDNSDTKEKYKSVYERYVQWCKDNSETAVKSRELSEYLRENYVVKEGTANVLYCHGFRLKSPTVSISEIEDD